MSLFKRLAVTLLCGAALGNLLLFGDLAPSLSSVAIGLCLLSYGYIKQQRTLFTGGILLVAMGFIHQIFTLFHYVIIHPRQKHEVSTSFPIKN